MTRISSPMDVTATTRLPAASVLRKRQLRATVWAAIVVGFAGVTFAVFDSNEPLIEVFGAVPGALGLFAATGCAVSMRWRRSYPSLIFVINLICAVLLPIGPVGTLLALTWVLPVATRRQAALSAVGAAAVTAISLAYDWARPPEHSIFASTDPTTEAVSVLTGYGYVLVGAMAWMLAVGVGMVRKYQTKIRMTEQQVRDSEQVALHLRGTINRQEERELIARDMHDTIAHELSVIALHASVLEVGAVDEETKEGVKAVRRSANRGLSELRSIIGNLRDGHDGGYDGAQPSIAGLASVVDESRRAGVRIQDVIEVRGSENLAATVSNGIYRIVQESVTNAIRHAPESPISVSVIGGPHEGIKIIVASWLSDEPQQSQGSGSGIVGMQERARALGGDLTTGIENGMWVVRGYLPWRAIEDS